MIGFLRHGGDHLAGEGALGRKAERNVGAFHRLFERAHGCFDRMGRFPLVHAFGAAPVDDAARVAEHDILRRQAERLEQVHAGDAGGARAVHHHAAVPDAPAGQVERVDEAGGRDDRGAVLVVVEDRDVEQFAQALLDDEAFRRLDVLQVDAAEALAEIAHAVDEGVDVLRVHLEVYAVHVGEAFEEDRLSFHDGFGGERADVAEAEHGGAVGDHGDHVAPGGVVVGEAGVLLDLEAGRGHARRIGERKLILGGERLGRRHLHLAGPPGGVHPQRLAPQRVVVNHRACPRPSSSSSLKES